MNRGLREPREPGLALPAWTDAGLLPPGIHRTELSGIRERFVLDAPHRPRRELLFEALALHLKLFQAIVPAGLAWIDGSFCRCGPEPPKDVDIVIRPTDWDALRTAPVEVRAKMFGLITLQDARATTPPFEISRLQPVGGVIDAYVCQPGKEAFWQGEWARVLDERRNVVSGSLKGYAEVAW